MKLIPLTQGKFAQVDDEDYEWLIPYKWTAYKGRNTYYAKKRMYVNGKRTTLIMHRLILKLTNPKEQGDHINHNGLDNQRHNLRKSTQMQNSQNVYSRPNSTSKYIGVDWDKERKKWRAYITVNYKRKQLGRYETEQEAALARNEAAKQYYSEFTNLNVV